MGISLIQEAIQPLPTPTQSKAGGGGGGGQLIGFEIMGTQAQDASQTSELKMGLVLAIAP